MLLGFVILASAAPNVIFCCSPNNDAYRLAESSGSHFARCDTASQAIAAAKPGSSVLILDTATGFDEQTAQAKNLRIYWEKTSESNPTLPSKELTWERIYVNSDSFGGLGKGRILSIGRTKILAADADHTWLSAGRVAGFDRLAFGPPKKSWPILWSPEPGLLESVAPLSHFATARFAPSKAWLLVWKGIFGWLGWTPAKLRFQPEVRPSFELSQPLPRDAEKQAIARAAHWFLNSHLLMTHEALPDYFGAGKWDDRVGPAPASNGDGSLGILEGYSSRIDTQGEQPIRWYRRSDCNAESAMALALSGSLRARKTAQNLAGWDAFHSVASQGARNDPSKPSCGLVGWNDLPGGNGQADETQIFYGDDNARYILGLIGVAGALHTNRYDEAILRCILANFRTTGVNGFRGNSLNETDIDRLGWRHFFEADTINMAPHFESYLWACELWAYAKTGYKPLLERAERAIERTMRAGENAWTWTNGLQQERARMLLSLAWLVRVDDSDEHRSWLKNMADKVISYQAPCGALREEFGDLSHGIAGPPRSNEAYGTAETPLIQENGDPLADLLYTSNFALLGLHEAAYALHDPAVGKAESRLAAFLCRIQIRSTVHPELDGAWFRAFDYGDWDYWASNADAGWGAWSIETGWSVSWISAVLALRQRGISFWDCDPGFRPDRSLIARMGL